jgi:hypothetical protein
MKRDEEISQGRVLSTDSLPKTKNPTKILKNIREVKKKNNIF